MNKIAVVAVCDFMKLPNGGEVFIQIICFLRWSPIQAFMSWLE